MKRTLALLPLAALLFTSCAQVSAPMAPNAAMINALSTRRAPGDLVEVPGFQAGDKLKIQGPLFFKGEGKAHALSADSFKVELKIASYHLIADATRIDAQRVRFITTDLKANKTQEVIGTYTRTGNVTVFDMGKGSEIERLTVNGMRPGYFEATIVQPGRANTEIFQGRGSTTLKITRG